ncbi:NAD(P)-dependent oxidoreductase [Pseudonocardia sp. WMMC193]|uniref:NAD(P)-dependent oxidoreductase n=1 Tax=Pseudonocardia sp. WMMC193 TaxID=2911965 RepID=UPI001F352E06|nr:NAD(P)H-binding protein [Pseudonocardia sp. WMMC193]MCF7547863.1 NAD(P)H-binding protein [Pseudonocardia sp. WMMC193]
MHLTILGATGGTGRILVDQALAAGHKVTAAVRRPEAVTPRDGLDVVACDVRDPAAVEAAVAGRDAVLSALGGRFTPDPVDVYSVGVGNAVAAMRRHGVRRIVVVSSTAIQPDGHPGGGFVFDRLVEPVVARVLARTLYADVRRMEALLRASDLDWTIARASGLFDVPAPTPYTLTEERSVSLYTARADLAAALLEAAAGDRFVRRVMAVSTVSEKPNILGLIWREGINRR